MTYVKFSLFVMSLLIISSHEVKPSKNALPF